MFRMTEAKVEFFTERKKYTLSSYVSFYPIFFNQILFCKYLPLLDSSTRDPKQRQHKSGETCNKGPSAGNSTAFYYKPECGPSHLELSFSGSSLQHQFAYG